MKKANLNLKTNRKLRLGATATLLTVVVIAAVMILNVIVGILYNALPLSLDLTKDNTYTLSETSHKVAKNVKKDVEILIFAEKSLFESSTEIPPRQLYLFTQEYAKLSGGRIKTKYLDMIADPTLKSTYSKYEVEPGDILFLCGDQHRKVALEDLYEYDDYTGGYTTSLVEMKLASSINAISGDKVVTLTFVTGHGENESVISAMSNLYERNGYDIDTLDLATEKQPLDTAQAMFIVGPQEDFAKPEIDKLASWLYNGGDYGRQLIVLLDYAAKSDMTRLYGFLENNYGITVTNDLIVETDPSKQVYGELGAYTVAQVQSSELTNDPELVGKKVLMPYTLRLELKHGTDEEADYYTSYPLITYNETAQVITEEDGKFEEDAKKDAESYPLVGMAYTKEIRQGSTGGVAYGGVTHVLVSGSYAFPHYSAEVNNNFFNDNLVLYPIREICSLGDTVVIPSMDVTADVMAFASSTEMWAIVIVMLAPTVVLIVVCLVVFLRRRHL